MSQRGRRRARRGAAVPARRERTWGRHQSGLGASPVGLGGVTSRAHDTGHPGSATEEGEVRSSTDVVAKHYWTEEREAAPRGVCESVSPLRTQGCPYGGGLFSGRRRGGAAGGDNSTHRPRPDHGDGPGRSSRLGGSRHGCVGAVHVECVERIFECVIVCATPSLPLCLLPALERGVFAWHGLVRRPDPQGRRSPSSVEADFSVHSCKTSQGTDPTWTFRSRNPSRRLDTRPRSSRTQGPRVCQSRAPWIRVHLKRKSSVVPRRVSLDLFDILS